MKISTKGRYALRVMLDLAEHNNGEFIPLKEIAARQEVTVKYLEQIISALNKSGYLLSMRGNTGGYKLLKSPYEIRVGDILRDIEGNLAPIACLEHEPNRCSRYEGCPTVSFWKGLQNIITDYVDSVTLEDLMKNKPFDPII